MHTLHTHMRIIGNIYTGTLLLYPCIKHKYILIYKYINTTVFMVVTCIKNVGNRLDK
jgi:hypothetical protein